MIKVGILGFSRREGTFAEVGLRSWEEAGCAAVESALITGHEDQYLLHRPLVVRPQRAQVERLLRDWCDVPNAAARCELILTIGGTGDLEKNFLPEVTQGLLKEPMPEISDLLSRVAVEAGYTSNEYSRGVAGKRGQTLLINLPGGITGHADPQPLLLMTQALLPVLPEFLAAASELNPPPDS